MKEINLRDEITSMTEEWGLNVLYVRNNKYIRCKCYNQLYRTGNSKCKICTGFGHITTIEMQKVIYDNNYMRTGDVTNPGMGNVSNDALTLYMDYKAQPKSLDRIYVTGYINKLPQDVQRVYVITSVDEVRLEDGQIDGYSVTAKLRPDLLRNAKVSVQALSLKAKQIISKGGKYICPYNNIPT